MSQFYDQWSSHMTEDVPFYVRHAVAAEGPVVELGAGNGRVAIEVAKAGQEVIAVDLSDAMLTEGARRAGEAGVDDRITWVSADMRVFVADPPVSMVTIPFRSFLHLLTVEDQLATLACIKASLRAGGRLVCNFFTPDPVKVAALDGQRRLQTSFIDEAGRRCEVYATPTNELATQRLDVCAELEVYDDGRLAATTETTLRLRQVFRYEFEHLLARTGFEVEALYGDFDDKPYGPGPDEMIWIARKP
jgi:SAM-dependent methyltransferase